MRVILFVYGFALRMFLITCFVLVMGLFNRAYAASSCGTPPSDFDSTNYNWCNSYTPDKPQYTVNGQPGKFASAAAACAAAWPDSQAVTQGSDQFCVNRNGALGRWSMLPTKGCGDDLFYSPTGMCYVKTSCPAGQVPDPSNPGQCMVDCKPLYGQAASSSGWFDWGTSPTADVHIVCSTQNGKSCEAVYSGGGIGQRALVKGQTHYFANGQYTFDGYACQSGQSQAPASSASTPTSSCADGQDSAMMNGVLKCYDHKSGKPVDPASGQPTDKPVDPGSQSTSNTTTNPDGSQTTTTVTCDGTGCITTTTTKNPDGSTKTTTDGKPSDFCTQHPDSLICQKSAFQGGDCQSTAPTCTGDAIMCQVAIEQATRNCQMFEAKHQDYDDAKQDADNKKDDGGAIKDRTSDRDVSQIFKPSDYDGDVGSCSMQDKVAQWGGVSVTFPLSNMCTYAPLIKGIVMGLSALSCAMLFYYFMIKTG